MGKGRLGGGGGRCPPLMMSPSTNQRRVVRGAVIGGGTKWRRRPERENVFTEHLENGRRANSSKWPIDILYGRYAPIVIHDLQNAATHQK